MYLEHVSPVFLTTQLFLFLKKSRFHQHILRCRKKVGFFGLRGVMDTEKSFWRFSRGFHLPTKFTIQPSELRDRYGLVTQFRLAQFCSQVKSAQKHLLRFFTNISPHTFFIRYNLAQFRYQYQSSIINHFMLVQWNEQGSVACF